MEMMLLEDAKLSERIYGAMRRADWPWSFRELEQRFGLDQVEFIAALVELRLERKLRSFRENDVTYYEIP
ncbi:hypothetical protein HFO56_33900 [Rhizobium laguerreae]|uniref:hypothetical protein n=1 Tax=Rhizobium laguerreae TaxID=1076926 RepID=UPI001C90977B|nr:hypothetical protein [Rhizobium laguerreae]MBY3157322.1 hypothetical protein [Rhizobium laguerreae]